MVHVDTSLTPLEIATSVPVGLVDNPQPLPRVPRGLPPVEALEDAIRPALLRPPCLVAFSGGRDSSAVLAVATRLARREGLPLPVPVTMRFPDAAPTQESEWQELVVGHLDLDDRVRLDLTDELDLLGPVATGVLRRHGLLWPVMAYVQKVMMEEARGGSLVTGFFGDLVFGRWRYTALSKLWRRRTRPRRGHLRLAAAVVTPPPVRRCILRSSVHREVACVTWLSPPAAREFHRVVLDDEATEPGRWDKRLAWVDNSRWVRTAVTNSEKLAAETDTVVRHPIVDPRFLAALARRGGPTGLGDRTDAMRAVFAELLPDPVLERATKAEFTGAYWRSASQRFARRWDGEGVDPEIVDVRRLRAVWSHRQPVGASMLLVHQAWLATAPAHR